VPANWAVTGPLTPDCAAFWGGRSQRGKPAASTSHTGTGTARWTSEWVGRWTGGGGFACVGPVSAQRRHINRRPTCSMVFACTHRVFKKPACYLCAHLLPGVPPGLQYPETHCSLNEHVSPSIMSTHQTFAEFVTDLFDRQHIAYGVGPMSFQNAETPEEHARGPSLHATGVNAPFFHVNKLVMRSIKCQTNAALTHTTIAINSVAVIDFEEGRVIGVSTLPESAIFPCELLRKKSSAFVEFVKHRDTT